MKKVFAVVCCILFAMFAIAFFVGMDSAGVGSGLPVVLKAVIALPVVLVAGFAGVVYADSWGK